MTKALFILQVMLFIGCSQANLSEHSKTTQDSVISIETLGAREGAILAYFQSFETYLANDSSISKEDIPKVIQQMIDKGLIATPEITVDSVGNTITRLVDYATYKEFRKNHPIDSTRQYAYTYSWLSNDSLRLDSMRRSLLAAFLQDSIQKAKSN